MKGFLKGRPIQSNYLRIYTSCHYRFTNLALNVSYVHNTWTDNKLFYSQTSGQGSINSIVGQREKQFRWVSDSLGHLTITSFNASTNHLQCSCSVLICNCQVNKSTFQNNSTRSIYTNSEYQFGENICLYVTLQRRFIVSLPYIHCYENVQTGFVWF